MSDDIVTRLRDRHATTWHSGALPSIFSAAADEIERLRQALFEIERLRIPPGTWRVTVHDDGTIERVRLRLSAAAQEAWSARMWADEPEQGDDR